jgi:hypothetical protein
MIASLSPSIFNSESWKNAFVFSKNTPYPPRRSNVFGKSSSILFPFSNPSPTLKYATKFSKALSIPPENEKVILPFVSPYLTENFHFHSEVTSSFFIVFTFS